MVMSRILLEYLIRKCASEILLKMYKEKHAHFFIIDNGVLKAQDTQFLEHYGYHYGGNSLSCWSGAPKEKQRKLTVYGVLKTVKVNQMLRLSDENGLVVNVRATQQK